jgi:hypothetical protein
MVAITEQVRRFARRFRQPIRCSACQVPHGSGRRLISGPGVYICESCVAETTGQEISGPRPNTARFAAATIYRSRGLGRESPPALRASSSRVAFWRRTIGDRDPPPNVPYI